MDVLLLLVSRQQVGPMERPVTARALKLWRPVAQLMPPEKMGVSKRLVEGRGGEFVAIVPQMLGASEGLSCCCQPWCRRRGKGRQRRPEERRTLGGLQISQMWTGNPFLALLTRPVLGVILGANWGVEG
jgi:hypothetical protein